MYNTTINHIKHNKGTTIDYRILRTKKLKDERDNIIKKSGTLLNNFKLKIRSHILDCAIKLACANFKSAKTNLKNGNIKHFRIRYWKYAKNIQCLEIGKEFFGKHGLCYLSLIHI